MSIDKRKNYYMVYDTETAGTLEEPLVYDIGGAIVDKHGNIYETFSFIVSEIFMDRDLMSRAHFANKIPTYQEEILLGKRVVKNYLEIKRYIKALCDKYSVKAIMAHNAYFDYKATKNTNIYLTNGQYKYFLPYGVELWDTLSMARDTIGKQKSYIEWCNERGEVTSYGKPRLKAETLYRYISGNEDFDESHTGLEDVLIEKEIFAHCLRQHKKMRKTLFNPR